MSAETLGALVEKHRDERQYPRPFVLGVLGNFSGQPEEPLPPLYDRVFVGVEWGRIDRLLAWLRPRAVVQVVNVLDDARPLFLDLRFQRMTDFDPRSLVERVPELAQLAANCRSRASAGPRPGTPVRSDRNLNAQLNEVLHAPAFQALEATWRGLHHMLARLPTGRHVRVRLFDVTQVELAKTLKRYRGSAWDQSPIFKRIYGDEYETFGGQPYTLLVGDFAFSHDAKDVELLGDLSQTMAAAHTVFLSAVSPALFGVATFAEAGDLREPSRLFRSAEYLAWRELCSRDDSASLALALPRVLMRRPHDVVLDDFGLRFTEHVRGSQDLLWGNPAYLVGADLFGAFAAHRCYAGIPEIPLGGLISRLPSCGGRTVEEDFPETVRGELESLGLITIHRFRDTARVAYSPPYGIASATPNPEFPEAKTLTYVPRRLVVGRTLHGLRSLARVMRGSVASGRDAKAVADLWLQHETGEASDVRDRIRLPLRASETRVDQVDDGLPECADSSWTVSAYCATHPFAREPVR